jgi:hypothetical protein
MAEKAIKQPDVFIWTGTDKRGVRVKGQTRGSNPNLIRADLRKQGITPIKVKKQTQLFSSQKKKITAKDIAIFFRLPAPISARPTRRRCLPTCGTLVWRVAASRCGGKPATSRVRTFCS